MIQKIWAPIAGAANKTVHRRAAAASAIAGLVAAALVLMTPNLAFERFIVATGLPGLVEAAAPPLGAKARLVFAAFSAGGVFAIGFAALSVVIARLGPDRPQRRSLEDEFFAYAPPAPRRRSDSHPDAPPRPPIKAGDDLGTPLDLVDIAPDEEVEDEQGPDSVWADGGPNGEPHWDEPDDGDRAEQLESELDDKQFAGEEVGGQSESSIPTASTPTLDDDERFDWADSAEEAEDWPSQQMADPTEPDFEDPATESSQVESKTAAEPTRAESEAPAELRQEASGSDLMALVKRLEAGIERRRRGNSRAANDAEEPEGKIMPHPTTRSGQDRELQGALRDALDALHKLDAGS